MKTGLWHHTFRRKLVPVLTIVGLIIIAGLVWLQHWSSAPAASTITVGTPASAAAPAPSYQPLTTPYFSTQIPSSWHIEAATTASNRLQAGAHAGAGAHGQLGITTAVLPSDGLRGVGDYNLRYTDTATYPRQTDPALPPGAELFSTTNTMAYTAFLVHNGRYAEITVSNLETLPATKSQLLQIIADWQWTAR